MVCSSTGKTHVFCMSRVLSNKREKEQRDMHRMLRGIFVEPLGMSFLCLGSLDFYLGLNILFEFFHRLV